MKPAVRVTILDDSGEKFFGEGPYRLLRAVETHGSLRAAAISMEMAYSKASKIIRTAEQALGFPLTERAIGGRDGGGSILTEAGRDWMAKYEAWRDACSNAAGQSFRKHFSGAPAAGVGCVIMASGLGKRFGGDKLMAEFCGKPLIAWILNASEGLFGRRIVVTRSEAVAQFCREHGAHVLQHDLPHRSDTVRLGLAAVGASAAGCLFCPADQPLITRESLKALLRASESNPGAILRLSAGGLAGAPVFFPAWCFPELLELPEGRGGGVLLERYPESVHCIEAQSPLELTDIDTPQALAELERQLAANEKSTR